MHDRDGVNDTLRQTAFVAGATGYTGSALVGELRRRNVDVIAHVRRDSSRLAEWREYFDGVGARVDTTAWDEDALAATLERALPDAVFALLGTTRARARQAGGGDYESVDYGLTALLLRAVRRSAPTARFVYLSSLGVGSAARGDYLRVRWRMEQELQSCGVPWTIVRPSFITGPDRAESRPLERVAARFTDALLDGAAALGARQMHERYSSMTAAQLAAALARHAFDPESAFRILETPDLRST